MGESEGLEVLEPVNFEIERFVCSPNGDVLLTGLSQICGSYLFELEIKRVLKEITPRFYVRVFGISKTTSLI